MKKLLIATSLLLAGSTTWAGDGSAGQAASPVVDTKPPSASATATYAPKHRSVFAAAANQHNPFWPIGWVKVDVAATADTPAPVIPRAEDFTVSTILLNEPPMAVINGKDMAEGEIAAMPVNGQNVTVQLMAVQDGRVILRWQNQNIIVPLHRDEEISGTTAALR